MSLFSFLFGSSTPNSAENAWNQTQREALVDLLYYAIYADNHLSTLEEHRITEELAAIHWDGAISLDHCVNRAITRARDARSDRSANESHLASIKERLGSESARSKAAALCEEVLRADGMADKERNFLKDVRAALAL